MDIVIGSGNSRRKFTALSGSFRKGSAHRVEVEHNAEDLKNYLFRQELLRNRGGH